MSIEGLMILRTIDAVEGREVATADIPEAFLQTNYDKGDIHIKLEGAVVTLIEEIDPEYYKDFIFTDKRGRKCMYAEPRSPSTEFYLCRIRFTNWVWQESELFNLFLYNKVFNSKKWVSN